MFPNNGIGFSSSLIAAINPINQHTIMKIPQIHPMHGITENNENSIITSAWFI